MALRGFHLVVCAALIVAPFVLVGAVEPDPCLLDGDQVEVIGPRVIGNGADALNLCFAGGHEFDPGEYSHSVWYDVPGSAYDLYRDCFDAADAQVRSEHQRAVAECLSGHVIAVSWLPVGFMSLEEARAYHEDHSL